MNHPNVHIKSECIYGDTYVYPLNIVHLAYGKVHIPKLIHSKNVIYT